MFTLSASLFDNALAAELTVAYARIRAKITIFLAIAEKIFNSKGVQVGNFDRRTDLWSEGS
jgi:hypothetical protein